MCIRDSGLTNGLRAATAKGQRFVLLHGDGKKEFVKNCVLPNQLADHHSEMGSDLFEKWFREQFLLSILKGSVVVMNNASIRYHSRKKKVPICHQKNKK